MNIGDILDDSLLNNKKANISYFASTPDVQTDTDPESIDLSGGMNFDFKEPSIRPTIAKDPKEEDAKMVVASIRKMMASGLMGTRLYRKILSTFPKESLLQAKNYIKSSCDREEGILGTILVDSGLFGGCREAKKILDRNPFRKYAKFVVNCNCGSHRIQMKQATNKTEMGGSISAFFTHNDNSDSNSTEICPITNLPVVSGYDELEENQYSIIDPMVMASKKKVSLKKLAASFIKANTEVQAKDTPVEDYKIEASKMEIAIPQPVKNQPVPIDKMVAKVGAIEVGKAQPQVDVEKIAARFEDINVAEAQDFVAVEMQGMEKDLIPALQIERPVEDLDVEDLGQELIPGSLSSFNKAEEAPKDLSVAMNSVLQTDTFEIDNPSSYDLDVDPNPFIESEFDGEDNIEVEKEKRDDFDIQF